MFAEFQSNKNPPPNPTFQFTFTSTTLDQSFPQIDLAHENSASTSESQLPIQLHVSSPIPNSVPIPNADTFPVPKSKPTLKSKLRSKPKSKSKQERSKPKATRSTAEKLDDIVDAIIDAGWTLGDFLCQLFSDRVEVKEGEQLPTRQKMILALLSGQCSQTLLQAIQLMYDHPYARAKDPLHPSHADMFSIEKSSASLARFRAALSTFALELVLNRVDDEAAKLTKDQDLRVRATRKSRHPHTPVLPLSLATTSELVTDLSGTARMSLLEAGQESREQGMSPNIDKGATVGTGSCDDGEDTSELPEEPDVGIRQEPGGIPHQVNPVRTSSRDGLASWELVGKFSFESLHQKYQHRSPTLWKIVTEASTSEEKASKHFYRPVWLVVTNIISEILFSRNQFTNLLQLCRGIHLFATKAHQSLFRLGSRNGHNVSYGSTRAALIQMSLAKQHYLRQLTEKGHPLWLCMDNIQYKTINRDHRIGSSGRMVIGTSGTAIEMEDCPPNAFDLAAWVKKVHESPRRTSTLEDLRNDIDWAHLEKVRALHWLDALVLFVPDLLAVYGGRVEFVFQTELRKHQINPNRHTKIHPLATNGANEVTIQGMKDALLDFLEQIGITKSTYSGKIQLFSGDGKSFEVARNVKAFRSGHFEAFSSFEHILELPEMWHTKWTEGCRICSGAWGDKEEGTDCDPSSLGYMAKAIKVPTPSDLRKVDFYSCARLIKVTAQAHMLNCWENLFKTEDLIAYIAQLKAQNKIPTFDKLRELATDLSKKFSSTEGYIRALSGRGTCTAQDGWFEEGSDILVRDFFASKGGGDGAAGKQKSKMSDESKRRLKELKEKIQKDDGGFKGDWPLANSTVILRDCIFWLELARAIAVGDIGRVWEVLKIWIITFSGGGNAHYTKYLLETWCKVTYELPEALRIAVFNNWLVNLAGKVGHFHEIDLAQERINFWLQELAQHKGKEFSDEFYRKVLSPNVLDFLQLKSTMEETANLTLRRTTHTEPSLQNELRAAMRICREFDLHRFYKSRNWGLHVQDAMAKGMENLERKGKFREYVDQSLQTQDKLEKLLSFDDDRPILQRYMSKPITFCNGELLLPVEEEPEET